MLELRPTCENCNKALPPHSTEAMICTFECTFCRDCAELLSHTCPNCAGGLVARPIRPATNWKDGNYLGEHPASTVIKFKPADLVAHQALLLQLQGLKPEQR